MEGHPEGVKKTIWGGFDVAVAGTAFTIQNGEDRFIVVANQYHHLGQSPYFLLRSSSARTPGAPPGYQVTNVRRLNNTGYDPAEIAAFIAVAESCAELPLPSRGELAELARELAISPAEIALIWMGGLNVDSYQNNFLPGELRTALGLKTTDANAGRQSLRNLDQAFLAQLLRAVASHGCAAPFAADRGPVLRSIEEAWRANRPRRLELDAALQSRLSALGAMTRWHRGEHGNLLAIAADPAEHPALKPQAMEIVISEDHLSTRLQLGVKNKNESAVDVHFFCSVVQLVALVHAETPAGHPARARMPALIEQTSRFLADSSTLLELRAVHLYDVGQKKALKPSEWLNKHLGKTEADPKDGSVRFDDGLIAAAGLDSQNQLLIAFRPAKLRDQSDLDRLQGILAVDVADGSTVGNGVIPVVAAIKSSGFQKLAKAFLAQNTPDGQWPENPKHTAKGVVSAIAKKYELSDDAAVLYAELLALPDPTNAGIGKWNGWTPARLKAAAAELAGGKLVLEATRGRAGRSLFLPGEWAVLKPPWLPIETWKLAHLAELDMNPHVLCPAGGPLVLRPFENLFEAAWQRVLDGDGPRYEEVTRRKKTK